MGQKIVEIADLKTGGKNDELVTYALGSCVGICMYDEGLHIGGLLHAMLPMLMLGLWNIWMVVGICALKDM